MAKSKFHVLMVAFSATVSGPTAMAMVPATLQCGPYVGEHVKFRPGFTAEFPLNQVGSALIGSRSTNNPPGTETLEIAKAKRGNIRASARGATSDGRWDWFYTFRAETGSLTRFNGGLLSNSGGRRRCSLVIHASDDALRASFSLAPQASSQQTATAKQTVTQALEDQKKHLEQLRSDSARARNEAQVAVSELETERRRTAALGASAAGQGAQSDQEKRDFEAQLQKQRDANRELASKIEQEEVARKQTEETLDQQTKKLAEIEKKFAAQSAKGDALIANADKTTAELRFELEQQKKLNATLAERVDAERHDREQSAQRLENEKQARVDLERRLTQTNDAVKNAKAALGTFLLPVTENPDSWIVRVGSVPVQQQQFCRVVDRFYDELSNVYRMRNDIRRTAIYRERFTDIVSLMPKGEFSNWVVRVVEVTQASDGSAAVMLQLPCRAMLGSNACEPRQKTVNATIPQTSPMYHELAKVSTGDFVIVSGAIDLVRDGSLDNPVPTNAVFAAGTHCSSAEGDKTQDVFVTTLSYLARLN